MFNGKRWLGGMACGLAAAVSLSAQELSAQAGVMGTGPESATSYAWQLEYRHRIVTDHFGWSASWLNEGHSPTHHRDGVALQGWVVPLYEPGDFSLGLGAGAYRYADTRFWPGDGYTNDHGWAPILSLSATWYTDSPWFFRLTGNHVPESDGLQTNTILAGVGYQLGWLRREPLPGSVPRSAHILSLMGGRTIVNSRSSEHASATVVEFRKIIGRHWDWTLSWLDEGDPKIMRRRGVATQLWMSDDYTVRGLTVGLGLGPYFLFSHRDPPTAPPHNQAGTAAIVSPTIAYELGASWQARLTWNRVFSRNNSDVDIIVMGLGYCWGRK